MTIDPKELRIGSHYYNGGYVERVIGRVTSINGSIYRPNEMTVGLIYDKPLDEDNDPYEHTVAVNLEPIPITPELLTELGFKCQDKIYWECWSLGSFDIERDDSKHFDYNSEIRLEYLHELENLYYLMCGKELIND